ncbi:DUF421 domain-containing protein [[Clostridium] cellulosi]
MWVEICEVVIRSICAYIILLIVYKLMSRKFLSQLTYFDFIVGVLLGAIAARISLGAANSLLLGIISAAVIVLLVLLSEWLDFKSFRFFKAIDGTPVVVICNGEIIDGNLKKLRISMSRLLEMLREKNFFNVGDVNFAIIESDGRLSVIPKSAERPVVLSDIDKTEQEAKLPVDLIMDGKLIPENLAEAGLDEQWLISQLAPKNLKVENIFYAALTTSGELYVSPKNGRT